MRERIAALPQNPAMYANLVAYLDAYAQLATADEWNSVRFAEMERPENQVYIGLTLVEAGLLAGKPPANLYVDLLIQGESCRTITVTRSEANLIMQYQEPYMSVCADSSYARGNWPRFLAGYVRDKGIMSLEEGIMRCTSIPASRLCSARVLG